eukprot:183952-Chlamydomonas_euryale.AAC.2
MAEEGERMAEGGVGSDGSLRWRARADAVQNDPCCRRARRGTRGRPFQRPPFHSMLIIPSRAML